MTDTPRTLAYILATLFPNNTTGDISPQDLRDFVVSAALLSDVGLTQVDVAALKLYALGKGVAGGLGVTAQSTPDMTVKAAAGGACFPVGVASTGLDPITITTADATYPRIDLIVISSANVISAVAGTPAAQPVAPSIPANSVALATVHVPAGCTTITSSQIFDKRIVLEGPSHPTGRHKVGATEFIAYEGSPSLLATDHYLYWALADTGLEGIICTIEVPLDWSEGEYCELFVIVANLSNQTDKVVRLNLKYKHAALENSIGGTSWTTTSYSAGVVNGDDVWFDVDMVDLASIVAQRDELVVVIERDGSHANDTYVGDIAILGIGFEYNRVK